MDDLSEYVFFTNPQIQPQTENAEQIDQSQDVQLLNTSVEIPPNQNVATIDQPELLNLLANWGVEILYEKCIEEEVDLDILKNMTSRHAELLTKDFKLGVLVKFESNLKKWQMNVNTTVSSSLSEHAKTELPSNIDKTYTSSQSSMEFVENKEQFIKLEELLQQSSQGKSLLEKYKKGIDLNDGCRTILLDIIVNYLIQRDIKMGTLLAEKIADEIISVFPKEIKAVYFFKESGKAPKGKLYSKYFNTLRSLKSCGLLGKRTYVDADAGTSKNFRCEGSSFLDPEDDIEEHLEAIKIDNCSWPEIEMHYLATSKHRLINISESSSTEEIFNNWRHYKSPLGYKLIDYDFKSMYPNSESLLQKFPNHSNELFQIIEQRIKDHSSLSLMREWKRVETPTDNGRYATFLYLLHAVLIPTSKVVKIDNGKKIYIKHSIKDSQNSFMIAGRTVEEAEAALQRKLEKREAIQPLIMLTGSIIHPENIVLNIDGVKFKFFSILEAFDICFKIIIIFNLEYPLASKLTWIFIQKFFYLLDIKNEKVHPNVSLLCSQLEQS